MEKSSRSVVLDLELTGLNPEQDRIISIGLVEVFNSVRIGNIREWFCNPQEREVDADGERIHGLTNSFLRSFPSFGQQINEMTDFIGRSPIIHHCWLHEGGPLSVDEKFMQMEFQRAGAEILAHDQWINLKETAKAIDPEHNSLNDMLDRFGIDRSTRAQFHGAKIDALLTAQLYQSYLRDNLVHRPHQ